MIDQIVKHEYAGITVGQHISDGYINATAMASAHKVRTGQRKDVSDWLRTRRTQEELDHLKSVTGIPVTELYQVFRGGAPEDQGTWIHPKLAIRFGMWLSAEFGYEIECWVKEWSAPVISPAQDIELKKLEMQNEGYRLQLQLVQARKEADRLEQLLIEPSIDNPKLPVEKAIPVDLPPISLRTQINNIAQRPIAKIRNRLLAQGTDPRTASSEAASIIWRRINKEFVDRYHFDLKARTRKGKKTRLQVAEEAGKLTELYTLVVALYGSEGSVSVEANPENS
jgi:KilA-N domain